MKYKDYLILPVLLMFLIYASCAYVAKVDPAFADNRLSVEAKIDPGEIVWGGEDGEYGENWYAEGARGTGYFSVSAGENNLICFFSGVSADRRSPSGTESPFVISGKHLRCTNNGIRYDFVFPDEMTAYDTISGIVYQRADYEQLKTQITSARFVNEKNATDYYVFKSNGKSTEYCGDRVFPGKWNLSTADTISLYDKVSKQQLSVSLLYDDYGNLSGLDCKGNTYFLAA